MLFYILIQFNFYLAGFTIFLHFINKTLKPALYNTSEFKKEKN